MYELLIINGMIVDGTGRKAYKGDIGINRGRIVEIFKDGVASAIDTISKGVVGEETGECIGYVRTNINSSAEDERSKWYRNAKEVIDAEGLVVCPGFIDVHSHNDLVPFMEEQLQELKLYQGVTTELIGQCGLGMIPCGEDENADNWRNYTRGVVGSTEVPRNFPDVESYFDQLANVGLKNNVAVLISHGAVKSKVMGFDKGALTVEQLEAMCAIVSMAMEAGAFGMSLGLQYMPGIYSGRDELIALCRVVKSYDGIVMVHLRNHDSTIIAAMEEIISIARVSGVRLHISHLRSYHSQSLGCKAQDLIKVVDEGVQSGVEITFDEHLYLSGSTLLTQLLPPWVSNIVEDDRRSDCQEHAAKNEGQAILLQNLKSVEIRERIKMELDNHELRYAGWDNYYGVTGWDRILITSVKSGENVKCVGKTVGELAREMKVPPVDFVADLLIQEQGGVGIVTLEVFSREDTIALINHPLQMVGSDSIPAGTPHPRLYGNYPLFFGKFVSRGNGGELKASIKESIILDQINLLDQQSALNQQYYLNQQKLPNSSTITETLLSLETAVYKATLLPAKTIKLKELGELAVNKIADITIFDFDKIQGFEDYKNPRTRPVGIKYVILNGKVALKDGVVLTGKYGRALRH